MTSRALAPRVVSAIESVRGELAICLAIAFAFVVLAQLVEPLTGDGGEYVAMFHAWTVGHRPWMTAVSWAAFDEFLARANLVEWARANPFLHLPALQSGATGDFNHFWFYSGLAALIAPLVRLFGVSTPAGAFLALHAALLCIPVVLAWRAFRWPGLLAVLVLTVLSPVFWLIDKIHTETFTHALVLSAVILFVSRRRLWAAAALACASTQNPSFAVIALAAVVIDFFVRGKTRYRSEDGIALALAALFAALHPVYYLARFGGLTPQAITRTIAPASDWSTVFVWFFDPDVGLFPNWPLGLALLALAAIVALVARREREATSSTAWWAFVACYLLFNLLAQARAINLNSGGTQNAARYAMWYVPLFFPVLERLFEVAKPSRSIAVALAASLAGGAWFAWLFYLPDAAEQIPFRPTTFSRFVQADHPGWYDPPGEVFAERYGGAHEAVNDVIAVVGPDCRKLLVFDRPALDRILPPRECSFSAAKILERVRARAKAMVAQADGVERRLGIAIVTHAPTVDSAASVALVPYHTSYLRLSDDDVAAVMLRSEVDRWNTTSAEGDAPYVLAGWWFRPEGWGAWSSNMNARLEIPCSADLAKGSLQLDLRRPEWGDAGPLSFAVRVAGGPPQREMLAASRVIDVPIVASQCVDRVMKVVLTVDRPTLDPTDDPDRKGRYVGIGITRFRFTRSP